MYIWFILDHNQERQIQRTLTWLVGTEARLWYCNVFTLNVGYRTLLHKQLNWLTTDDYHGQTVMEHHVTASLYEL